MSYIAKSVVTAITSATGAATFYSTVLNGELTSISAKVAGTTSTADVVVSTETTLQPVLTKANLIDADLTKAILFNIFGGITRGDDVARGIVKAIKQMKPAIPIVVLAIMRRKSLALSRGLPCSRLFTPVFTSRRLPKKLPIPLRIGPGVILT